MKKSGFIILVIIGIIALGIVLGITGKPEDVNNVQTNKINKNNTQNVDNSKNVENSVTNTENKELQNVEANNENTATETFNEEPKTEKDKAIDIVKLDYGNVDNVTINVEGINNNGTYTISVRDKNTTQALAFYTVNVSEQTFTKREMN